MTNFILEIFSEEIPARMQKNAVENFAKIAVEIFSKNNLSYENFNLKTFVTPRRLVLEISGLKSVQEIPSIKKIGPKINADKKAINGFLKSVGLENEADLEKIENNGATCYLFVSKASSIKTADIIKNSLPQILHKMTAAWPKLMRFDVEGSSSQAKWVRPVRNILCLFDEEIIDVEFAGLKSNNITFGHYSLGNKPLEIKSAKEYKEVLKNNFIILDQKERKEKILHQVNAIKLQHSFEVIDDENSPLFDEVAGLSEYPTALLGNISEKFMTLPDELLILTLKLNQKYFCLRDENGALLPHFIFISNAIIEESNRQKITSDNEKLVSARLSDAQFFIEEDLKISLAARVNDLKKVVFHQKLGSVYDKTLRLKILAKFLSIFVPHSNLSLVERAVDLSKADLVTKAVAELPELQGKIGSFYANKQGEDSKISLAIYEHYLPLGPNSELPKTALGITLSIADKIDSIVGFFLADEKPTASKDPFALRRSALGIIRIGFKYNIAFPIRILVQKSLNSYPAALLKELFDVRRGKVFDAKKELEEEIIRFFVERLKSFLKENEMVKPDIINVVIDEYLANLEIHKNCDILYLAKKIKFLDSFVKNPDKRHIIELYKRSANILAIEEKKDGKIYHGKPLILLLKTKYEIVLYRRIKQIRIEFKKLIIKGEFESAFKLLDVLEGPLEHFFEHITVNAKNKKIRENRLKILSKIRSLFDQVADLSKIEI
ncbi:MAG: glycine--tRNA ligase subunit beta [Rickettsiales bacterium]|nr:glycine--tRNA ligase subunit beta [Rickettsiales bacterium]